MNEALAKLQSFQQIISHSINEHKNDFFLFFILLLNVRDDILGVIWKFVMSTIDNIPRRLKWHLFVKM